MAKVAFIYDGIKTDIYNSSNLIYVLYKNNDYVIFNYINGNILEEYKENSKDLKSYFISSFGNTTLNNTNNKKYQESKELVEKLKERNINTVLNNGTKDNHSIVESNYKTIYNPTTNKYEIYEVPNINDDYENTISLDNVLNKESISNKIDNNLVLYKYYIGEDNRKKSLLVGVISIVIAILIAIIISTEILRKNILKITKEMSIN